MLIEVANFATPDRGGSTAAPSPQLAAILGDGATARSAGDLAPIETSTADVVQDLPLRNTFEAMELLSGTNPGPPLVQLAAHANHASRLQCLV